MARLFLPSLLASFLAWVCVSQAWAQAVFPIDSLPSTGVVLDKNWKWQLGDDPAWAKPDFDDSAWKSIHPAQVPEQLNQPPWEGIGWLRIRLWIAPQLRNQPITIKLSQAGATELFLNGRLMARNGKISPQKRIENSVLNSNLPAVYLDSDSIQVVAIRYAFSTKRLFKQLPIFLSMTLLSSETAEINRNYAEFGIRLQATLFGIFLILGVLQLLLYMVSLSQRATLYLGLFLVAQSFTHLMAASDSLLTTNLIADLVAGLAFITAITLAAFFYSIGIYTYFKQPKKGLFYVTTTLTLLTIPASLYLTRYAYLALFILGFIVPWADILRVGIIALNRKKSGAKVFTLAHGTLLAVFILYTLAVFVPAIGRFLGIVGQYMFTLSFLGLALTISILLAQERASANKLLQKQLVDLEVLSRKTIAQEQEKQQLLTNQNEQLEQQVEARTAQLNQSLTELKATQEQLIQKEKLASLGELTAGIAHEIQNPLNFVNNFSEVSTELVDELKEGPFLKLPDSEKEYAEEILGDLTQNLQKITHHGGRASSIVKGMLEHSRTSSGEKQPTDLNALADEYLRLAYQGMRAKDKASTCELITEFDPQLGQVKVVPQEIGRVLLNLYNNAFYAVSERARQISSLDYKPTVKVNTKRENGQVIIQVKDNGTGIPNSVKAKIFQPFFTTKPTGEGTGLGLSLSYDIVTKGHGGSLLVTSEVGVGSSFTLSLPLADKSTGAA